MRVSVCSSRFQSLSRHGSFRLGCFVLLLTFILVRPSPAQPSVDERRHFEAARIGLEDLQYEWAEQQFAQFARTYPESELYPQAILLQARAAHELQKHLDSLTLLDSNLSRAGGLIPEYRFWMAENHMAMGKLDEAGNHYGTVATEHPDSPLALEAAYRQALAAFKNGNSDETIRLLSDPDGPFLKIRRQQPGAASGVEGLLLLARCYFDREQFSEAANALDMLPDKQIAPEAAWRANLLYSRIHFRQGRLDEAEKLVQMAEANGSETGDPARVAEARSLHGRILEQLKRWPDAVAAYRQNLDLKVPAQWRREALLKNIELTLAQRNDGESIQAFEQIAKDGLDDTAPDLLQLTLGELKLKQFYQMEDASAPPGQWSTNAISLVEQAQVHFNRVIRDHPESSHLGKAWLNLGWCHWQKRQWDEARNAFSEAAGKLPRSLDRAIALLKLGDSEFRLGLFDAANSHYGEVARDYADDPVVRSQLLDQVYYQMIQASIRNEDAETAGRIMNALLDQFPESYHAERGLLLTGQALMDVREPEAARGLFEVFIEKFPNSSLLPRVRLALARTYSVQGQWDAAVTEYQNWLGTYPEDELLPEAEFGLALTFSRAGNQQDALPVFTNFVTRFPAHSLTPKALQWSGDFHYNHGNYTEAERYYQVLFQSTNWPPSVLTYEAQVWAARAARQRQGYRDAKRYLTNLLNNTNCPPELLPQVWFAYGDVTMEEPDPDTSKYKEALEAFDMLITRHQKSPLVPLAWGRFGDCNFQLRLYTEATNAYITCMMQPEASASTRSQAMVKLGQVIEKQSAELPPPERGALLQRAMDHYLNVFYELNLKPDRNEEPDPYWIKQAAFNAAELAESQNQFEKAARIYERLLEKVPAMKEYLERRIRQMNERQARLLSAGG